MVYKTLFITDEEKNILKDLVFQNDPKIFKALEVFENSFTLYVAQEEFRNILDSLEESSKNDENNKIEEDKKIPIKNLQIRKVEGNSISKWIQKDNMLIRWDDRVKGNNIVSFGLDDCLVLTKSKRNKPVNELDWEWKFQNIHHTLLQLHNNFNSIIIFTNQFQIQKKQ